MIIKSNVNEFERYFTDALISNECDVYSQYKKRRKLGTIIAIVLMKYLKIPYQSWNYGKWKKVIRNYDKIIVFDRIWNYSIIKYIRKKNKNCKLILWCWNKLERPIPQEIRDCCEVWSFDELDCEKYNINKNIQFYHPRENQINEIKQDVYFVGGEKNRGEEIINCVKTLEDKGYKVKCEILSNNQSIDSRYRISKLRSYNSVIDEILSSKCILDITMKNQSGITLRVLEAIFYSKKLITNNENIKNFPFYCTDNIYVYNGSNAEGIDDFIKTPYNHQYDAYKNEFTVLKWLENFK